MCELMQSYTCKWGQFWSLLLTRHTADYLKDQERILPIGKYNSIVITTPENDSTTV